MKCEKSPLRQIWNLLLALKFKSNTQADYSKIIQIMILLLALKSTLNCQPSHLLL